MPKLVLIDIQRDFFEGGASPLPQAEQAASAALVSDACAASPLGWGGRQVDAPDVHAAFLAALEEFATIAESGEALASFA